MPWHMWPGPSLAQPTYFGDRTRQATGTGDGCTILYTDSVKSERIQQIALSFTIAQTAYIVITTGNSEDKTQVVITVNATE